MRTHELFSTQERTRLLKRILSQPDDVKGVRGIARDLDISPSLVSNYLKLLRQENIRVDGVKLSNPKTRVLKTLMNLEEIENAQVVETILEKIPSAEGVGIYGSWANGTNHIDSDVDIWVKTKQQPGEDRLAELQTIITERLKNQASILALTKQRISKMRDEDRVFYFSLHHSMTLWGEDID